MYTMFDGSEQGRLVRTASGLRQFNTQEGFAEVSYKDQIRALEKERVEEAMYTPLPEEEDDDEVQALTQFGLSAGFGHTPPTL